MLEYNTIYIELYCIYLHMVYNIYYIGIYCNMYL